MIFDQKYEHEGNPYLVGDKIFIRTELIFEMPCNYEFVPDVAKYFNISCYLTGQSMFEAELQKYSNQMFNHTCKLRINLATNNGQIKLQYFHKSFQNVHFITNGHNYWFEEQIPLKIIGKLIVLDYFNGKYENMYARNLFESKIIDIDEDDIFYFLKQQGNNLNDNNDIFSSIDKDIRKLEELPIINGNCCDYHVDYFIPEQCESITKIYNARVEEYNNILNNNIY